MTNDHPGPTPVCNTTKTTFKSKAVVAQSYLDPKEVLT